MLFWSSVMYIDHRYEVIESLGSGSWANVYKVRDIREDKIYSLKLFQYLSSEELYKHFSAEDMHHITQINHPNLAHVVDFGHVGDHIYFISEYFEGRTLANFKFSKNRVGLIYDVVVQTCYALDALHSQNILHKDLKLENVLYKMEGSQIEINLIDYGFSKINQEDDKQNVTGSLPYLAPELYTGQPASHKSDFYALGVMLYRLCTGSFPYSLDQINALISGGHQYFIPKFPSTLNRSIPPELERFILRLLERNPENRFENVEEIIAYINRIQHKEYSFSASWSVVNTMTFNSYMVRESYAHQLLDYLPAINNSNGKIVSLIGGDGLGKDSIMSLFRYHLLGREYYLFDYSCSQSEHDPFFALIKEYLQSISKEELKEYEALNSISERFKHYLFSDVKEAKKISQTAGDIRQDFESVKDLLIQLSLKKPVIFLIRNFQHVGRHTIEFLNYLSSMLVKQRMLIVFSCTDFNKAGQIDHVVLTNIPFLSYEESLNYIHKLLPVTPPEALCREIFERSAGNPHFIKEILIDLVQRDMIQFGAKPAFIFTLKDYTLPNNLMHSIYARMRNLTTQSYALLQRLSVVQTKLDRELMIYLLKISDTELYNMLNDAIYNEILAKDGKYYRFTFKETKKRMVAEGDPKLLGFISKRLLQYHESIDVVDKETCFGLIENSYIAKDYQSARKYYLKLISLYGENFELAEAYDAMLHVLELDFDPRTDVSLMEIIQDLSAFQEKTEMTGLVKKASSMLDKSNVIPELFEKYHLIGTIHLLMENYKDALVDFLKADELQVTGKQQLQAWLGLIQIYMKTDPEKAKHYLDMALSEEMPLELLIAFTDRLAVYYNIMGEQDRAIKILEDFLMAIPPEHDAKVMIRLATMHNDLGVFYSNQKNIEEANEHLYQALNIWKRYNIRRYLGLIYNNLSDLYLKQGDTLKSIEFSQLALQHAEELNLTTMKALSLLNQGEAKIKMGYFQEAETLLDACYELEQAVGRASYKDSVKRNLALTKSKIKGFGYYFDYILQNEPDLIKGHLREINPLVKTYFYYLSEMMSPKKLRSLLGSNVDINFKLLHEEEFHHNVLSLIAMAENRYDKALEELKLALHYAGEINNLYAITVFYTMEAMCNYGLGNYSRAQETINKGRELATQNNYRYWLCKLDVIQLRLDLLSTEIPLRDILRRVKNNLDKWMDFEYYQLNVELMQIRLQILLELKQDSLAEKAYAEYQEYLFKITENTPKDDRSNYLSINEYQIKNLKKFDLIPLKSRARDSRRKWNELLFDIANVNNLDRIKFLIEKGVNEVFSPWRFQLMQYSEKIQNYTIFHSFNFNQSGAITARLSDEINRAMRNDNLVITTLDKRNVAIIPLQAGFKQIGYLILSDDGELPFTRQELAMMRNIRQHLAALLLRIQDYSEITMRIQKMNQLIEISHDLMRIVDIDDLEQEIVSSAIDFTNAGRGFLIKRDSDGNNIYKVQMDREKQFLTKVAGVSKSVLAESQSREEMISTFNAMDDKRFMDAISVQDYRLYTIFCTPIIVNDTIFGFLYLDNMDDNRRAMYLKQEIISLYAEQVSIAIKNAMHYESILQKSNELKGFELLKDEFMAIVSHELNTPLTTLQSYVSRLKRKLYSDEDEKDEIVDKIERSVKKLILTAGDITTMNRYNLTKELNMSMVNVNEILELVQQEVEILSRNRKMFIRLEVEKKLPELYANWEGLHLMIYNLVLNAIRFTNDFGTIIIGARMAAFHQERIEGKESMVFFVQDNGIGIPEYQIKNVFRKFYELNEIYAHKSGTVEYRSSGLGLGLSTSKRIVDLHGGNIWIKSVENRGTTVFVSMPLKQG